MPTLPQITLPPPSDWQEFESIVRDVFRIEFSNNNFTKNGRPGQKQNGVDIYSRVDESKWLGVQCKLTTKYIKEQVIEKEIKHAEKFTPPLSSLYIATTQKADAKLQELVRSITEERKREGKFDVHIKFWEDINNIISEHSGLTNKYYPQLVGLVDQSRVKDVRNLKQLLEVIDIGAIRFQIDKAPYIVSYNFLTAKEFYGHICNQPSFFFRDADLSYYVFSWLNKWSEIIDTGLFKYFPIENSETISYLRFHKDGDRFFSNEDRLVYNKLKDLYCEYWDVFSEFIKFLKENYDKEIDLYELNQKARKFHFDMDENSRHYLE